MKRALPIAAIALICALPSSAQVVLRDIGVFSDLDGSVRYPLPTDLPAARTTLEVDKAARTLTVLLDDRPLKTYPIALGFTPKGDKRVEGDGKTPEGEYTIVELRHESLPAKYGARSLLLSYPGPKDARRGVAAGQIDRDVQRAIDRAATEGTIPPQTTPLGSSIRIHGGGVGQDWTAGCIALRDPDVAELYGAVQVGTRVRIAAKGSTKRDLDGDGIPNPVDAALGALKTDLNDASYDGSYLRIPFPGGDVPRTVGVCTDVVVRALRNAGLDLQAEIQRDVKRAPKAYHGISTPNANIDHRRVKNQLVYFKRHFEQVPLTTSDEAGRWLPGDIVLFDTLPKAGPDHIGVVSPNTDENGLPLVINNWTYGAVTDEMDLLSWCTVTHHFRWR